MAILLKFKVSSGWKIEALAIVYYIYNHHVGFLVAPRPPVLVKPTFGSHNSGKIHKSVEDTQNLCE